MTPRDLGTDPDHARVREELLARVMDGWSGARIEQRTQQLSSERALVRESTANHPARESERWAMPAGVNYRTKE